MIWSDKGFLLSKNKFQENSVVANFYTLKHGKRSGIVFGATSKKIKNYLEIGNELHIQFSSKNENSVGYFKPEIISANSPIYFSDKKKLNCIVSTFNLIYLLTVENQTNKEIYESIKNFYILLKDQNWRQKLIFWELNFLKLIGFDLDIKKYAKLEIVKNKKEFRIKTQNNILKVPEFLIDNNIDKVDEDDLLNAFNLINEYMKANIFSLNNINFPLSRLKFIEKLSD
tara:strand:- start:178 stop:861 length:684 start_codon:yes stop_codon:yes gene_type:complete